MMDPALVLFLTTLGILGACNVLRLCLVSPAPKEEDRCLADHAVVPRFARLVVVVFITSISSPRNPLFPLFFTPQS